jgi:hypothetical protein
MIQILFSNYHLSQFQSHDTLSKKTTDNLKSNHLLSFVSSASCDRQRSNWLTLREFCRTVSHSPVQYPVISNGSALSRVFFAAVKKSRVTVATNRKIAMSLVHKSFILRRK